MTDLTIVPKWNAAINRLERNEFATGGADGNMNIAPRQLAESVFWLKDELDKKADTSQVVAPAWGNITGDIAAQTDLGDMYFSIAAFQQWSGAIGDALDAARVEGDFYGITTPEPPNTHIDADGKMKRSTAATATLGTAATKDVGAGDGEISLNSDLLSRALATRPSDIAASINVDTTGVSFAAVGTTVGAPSEQVYVNVLNINGFGTSQVQFGLPYNDPSHNLYIRSRINGQEWGSPSSKPWAKIYHSQNTQDSNLEVKSIQAGIGAPKLAYKKLTGAGWINSTTIAHGLDASKILAISISYLNVGTYQTTHRDWDATYVKGLAISTNAPFKILITYEVD